MRAAYVITRPYGIRVTPWFLLNDCCVTVAFPGTALPVLQRFFYQRARSFAGSYSFFSGKLRCHCEICVISRLSITDKV